MAAAGIAVSVALLGALGAATQAARAGGDPIKIRVNTTLDVIAADGLCSLREAIIAGNGLNGGNCGTGSGQGDAISFSLSCPSPPCVINVGSNLPNITKPTLIGGGTNRVKLHGPGTGIGLNISSAQLAGASVSRMIIENFDTGISTSGNGVTITGNIIGPVEGDGILVTGGSVQIGSSIGGTPGGPCTGGCNVVSDSNNRGINITGLSSGVIEGNFIGTTASGNAAADNFVGVQITNTGTWTIGGTAAGAGNVISGNARAGLIANNCNCTIQGNFVGTNAAGTAAVPNGENGFVLHNMFNTVIGGDTTGSRNTISGNFGHGIILDGPSQDIDIIGNRIGTSASGGALGNTGDGIRVSGQVADVNIGLPVASSTYGNTIAFNSGAGVDVVAGGAVAPVRIYVRGNSIHSNGGLEISVGVGANGGIMPPSVTGVGPVSGTACAGCDVDIYSDSGNDGRRFEGTAFADASGNWIYPGSVTGPFVTATSNEPGKGTSPLSSPVSVSLSRPDGRIRKGRGAFVGNNIYNTNGTNQTKSGAKPTGATLKFGISIQNDSPAGDRFKVSALAGTSMYSVKYFRGTTNITSAVVAGTYLTSHVAPAGTFLITVKVKVLVAATAGSAVARLVTISSNSDSSKVDAVKFIGARL